MPSVCREYSFFHEICRWFVCVTYSERGQHSTRSALVSVVVVVTEALDATTNGIAQTEPTK